ncbi:energy-coupling factor transporter transmembrane component T family protein [Acetonema longum]|uniref:Cobalt transporter n=1 Tax=Acetonema longum DSM 6540 TaxID=1009370 RepID=F7NJ14_9FIRM|nr:energy-coupling factor transporter transmembrane component T [Acetonema longum]EGO64011.1 cobalt transporter [Acetonema longum DSM 6540]
MRRIAPLTKLAATFLITVWAFLLKSPLALGGLTLVMALLVLLGAGFAKGVKTLVGLSLVGVFLIGLQYLLGTDMTAAVAAAFRMFIMCFAFIILLATTRIQDLTTALVSQCRIPYEFAFMFTAALRFVPDLLAESRAVQEAQACRGYSSRGSLVHKFMSYITVVQPLVLRSISRSETMAMSLELRGFAAGKRSFIANVALSFKDYTLLAGFMAVTFGLLMMRLGIMPF